MITDARPELELGDAATSPRSKKWMAFGLAALLVIGVYTGKALWPEAKVDVREGTTVVDADGMAARYGIKVTLVATSAAGGVVDFRYQVVDPDKANPLMHDVDLLPKLVVEDSGATIALSSLPHSHGTELQLGGNYFFLMANANNALHPGSLVTVIIGDARLEHVVAQG